MLMDEIDWAIRNVLGEHSKLDDLDKLGDGDDLYGLGMTSHAVVSVMLALEEEFDVEFPERMLQKSTFVSIDAIRAAVTQLREQ
jgi:acyl carrier protein